MAPKVEVLKKPQAASGKSLADERPEHQGTPKRPMEYQRKKDKTLPWWMKRRENSFIKRLGHVVVTVTTATGATYRGTVDFWDTYSFGLTQETDGKTVLIMKCHVEAMVPTQAFAKEEV